MQTTNNIKIFDASSSFNRYLKTVSTLQEIHCIILKQLTG